MSCVCALRGGGGASVRALVCVGRGEAGEVRVIANISCDIGIYFLTTGFRLLAILF